MTALNSTLNMLFIRPEKIVPGNSRLLAYVALYILPLFISFCLTASAIYYGNDLLIIGVPIALGAFYVYMVRATYRIYTARDGLHSASNDIVPEALIKYFRSQEPGVNLPVFFSNNREWIAYGHIDPIKMAREITYLKYRKAPPPPKFEEYYMEHKDTIKHHYLAVIDPDTETFRLSPKPIPDHPSYPVTVFYEGARR